MSVPEVQHAAMRAAQGKDFVEAACANLYYCALLCRADGVPWPEDLDAAHAILWCHLGRDATLRETILGGKEASE